jgi:hypothetical protein
MRVAHAAFPTGHPYLRLADELGTLFTDDYVRTFAKRAGIEGTLSRAIRRTRLRRTRSIGDARVHLSHLLAAVALNFLRLGEWLTGAERAKTRRSPCARLMALTV